VAKKVASQPDLTTDLTNDLAPFGAGSSLDSVIMSVMRPPIRQMPKKFVETTQYEVLGICTDTMNDK
jgi:hypothetical protein